MNEKKTFKEQVKDWWNDNKRVIKVGAVCGLLGIAYGFAKGCNATDNLWLRNGFEPKRVDPPCDEYGVTELNCDDPELLELIRMENENA